MKLYLTVVIVMVSQAAGEVDKELQDKYLTMDRIEFMEIFNKMNKTWTMKHYPESDFSKLNFGNKIHEHTLRTIDQIVHKRHPTNIDLPDNFDARQHWPSCRTIREIYSQGRCNSCWAHAVANTASDRICIHNHRIVDLSEQDLECSHFNRTICHTGDPIQGLIFWKNVGLVTRQCKPYQPWNLNRQICELRCQNHFLGYKQDKHFAENVYFLEPNDYQIKAELYLNGPIQASLPLFEDFQDQQGRGYSSGIYVHTFGKNRGYHAVRVIGYGVENGVDYWLVANSWGTDWGENGLFRIKRFQPQLAWNGVGFETRMCSGLPKKRYH